MKELSEKTRFFILKLEEMPMTALEWMSGFLVVVIIRFFLEGWSSRNFTGFLASDLSTNLHYAFFYLGTTLAFTLVLSIFSRVGPEKTINIMLFGLPIIWVAPITDLLLTGGAPMAYLFETPHQLAVDLLTFFGPIIPYGVTLGMRIEFALMLIAVGTYLFMRTRSWWWTILGSIAAYMVIFLSVSLPSVLVLFSPDSNVIAVWVKMLQTALVTITSFHPTEAYGSLRAFELLFNAAMMQIWYLLTLFFGLLFLRRASPRMFSAVLPNIRPTRIMHYVALFIAGALFALFSTEFVRPWVALDAVTLIVGLLSLCFAWIFSVATNDLVDEPIDRISNASRPLITGVLSRGDMRDIAIVSAALAILGGLALGSYSAYLIIVYLAAYYIYSVPPLRLKRIPLLSSFLISLAHLAAALLGFFLISEARMLADFPKGLALLLVLGFTLAANAKDLKDVAGDKAEGIVTIPVLLGEKWGRIVIGGMLFLGFLLIPFCLSVPVFLVPCLLTGTIVWIGVVRKMGERFIVGMNIANVAVLLALYFSSF